MIDRATQIRLAEARLARAAHGSVAEYWSAVRSLTKLTQGGVR